MRRFSEGDYRILLDMQHDGYTWVGGEGISPRAAIEHMRSML